MATENGVKKGAGAGAGTGAGAPSSVPARTAPGPRGVPWFGSTLDAWRDPIDLFLRSSREHGDVLRFRFGPYKYFLINDADAIHHVLVDNNRNYTKSRNYRGLKRVLGDGLITSEGDFWRRQRKLAQPAFHRERLSALVDVMAKATGDMLERFDGLPRPAGRSRSDALDTAAPTATATAGTAQAPVIDVHAEMMRLTFQIVGLTLFSTDVDGDAHTVGQAMSIALHYANDQAESMITLPQWVPTRQNLRFRKAMATLDELVLRIIAQRRRAAGDGAPAVHDLLAMLMDARDEITGEGMSDRQLRDEILTLALAGHETTANALSWTWYLLSKHPEVARRVVDECRGVLGGRTPTFADVPALRYTSMVIQESMRLYPPVWTFERQAIARDTLCGFDVPAGSIIGISPYTLHRNPTYWANPEGFDPERFGKAASEGRPRYAYVPFGAGPRQCIGNSFAMMEAQVVVAMVAQRYDLQLVPGHRVELEPSITLRPRHGVNVTLHRRDRSAAELAVQERLVRERSRTPIETSTEPGAAPS